MNLLTDADLQFAQRFATGTLQPAEFGHLAHLRLAYIHLASHGPDHAVTTFCDALQAFLQRSTVLHDPKIMLTHYSRHLLFSDAARERFIAPDLQPIPAGAAPPPAPSSPAPAHRAG